jgi:hypothetical protein
MSIRQALEGQIEAPGGGPADKPAKTSKETVNGLPSRTVHDKSAFI